MTEVLFKFKWKTPTGWVWSGEFSVDRWDEFKAEYREKASSVALLVKAYVLVRIPGSKNSWELVGLDLNRELRD